MVADLPLLSAFGSPSVDGTLSPGEWDGAAQLPFFADAPEAIGGARVPVTVLVQNDESTLYLALRIGRLVDSSRFWFTFDNDDDGIDFETGDDGVEVTRGAEGLTLTDVSSYPCDPLGATGFCVWPDTESAEGQARPGSADGAVAYSQPSETQVFEFSHPLRSGDGRDMDLGPGGVVGFRILIAFEEVRAPVACAEVACGGGGQARGRIARAAPDAPALLPGPSVTLTELGPAAVNGWHRAPTKVRVSASGEIGAPAVATRTWAVPASTPSLGGNDHGATGNAVLDLRGDGTTLVQAFGLDTQGREGAWVALPVRIDTAPPTVTAPRIVFRQGGIVGGTPTSTVISWNGADAASGVARYELQESVAGGGYVTVATGESGMTSVARRLTLGTVYRYRVRATDLAGNVSRWVEGMPCRVFLVDSRSDRVSLDGTWTTTADAGAIGGSVISTTEAGATASLEFLGSAIALIAPSGPGRGGLSVTLDSGALAGSKWVELGSPSAAARVAYRAEWSGNGLHAIEIRVEGTGHRPRIDLDAFLIVTPLWSPQAAAGGQLRLSFEAEQLAASGDVTNRPWVVVMSPWGRGLWSNNRELDWAPRSGETLQLSVPITPGRWKVRAYLTESPAGGVIRITCDSRLGPEIDLNGTATAPTGQIDLGTIVSSWSTTVPIGFTFVRPGQADGLTVIGIDRLEFEPA